ncbi:MAG TPA: hypothetical protein PKB10_01930, partial [Tepidisphaeraceae bacterium]|nr:hypothetical protein [Tepidisphaeraceae bacterium]
DHQLAALLRFGPVYPAERWAPVEITLRNDADTPADGVLELDAQDPGSPARVLSPVRVPPKSRVRLTLLIKLPDQALARGQRHAPRIATVVWRGSGGQVLRRDELLGPPDTAPRVGSADSGGVVGAFAIHLKRFDEDAPEGRDDDELSNIFGLAAAIEQTLGRPVNAADLPFDALPAHPAALEAVALIALSDARALPRDPASETALRHFVESGGTLLIACPIGQSSVSGTWIDPLMPVDLIGHRMVSQVGTVKLLTAVPAAEAQAREGAVVIVSDDHYVHAAYRALGLGRVVFLSVPLNALPPGVERSRLLRTLLDVPGLERRLESVLADSERIDPDADTRGRLLGAMVGVQTPPWSHAAWIAGLMLSIAVSAHLLIRGARRPIAFVVVSGAAVVIAAGLMMFASTGRGEPALAEARLAITDLGIDGAGHRTDTFTYFGSDHPALSLKTDPDTALHLVRAPVGESLILEQLPFSAPRAGARASGGAVWQARAPVHADRAGFSIAFTSDGPVLRARENAIALSSPLLLTNGRAFPLPPVPTGSAEIHVGMPNQRGDLTNFGIVGGEVARMRARVLAWAERSGAAIPGESVEHLQRRARLAGFVEEDRAIAESTATVGRTIAHSLVRREVRIEPTPVGQIVRVPGGMVRFVGIAARSLPMDAMGVIRTEQTDSWLIGFAAPREIGRLEPRQATLRADIRTPLHRITLQRGQCATGPARPNPAGPEILSLTQTLASPTIPFTLEPGDIDANGWVWLLLTSEQRITPSDSTRQEWTIESIELELNGEIVAPPQPETQTWPQIGVVR